LHNLRKVDIVCRFGGDEFALLLPETSADKAITAAEKLRAKVAACEFPGVARPVTVSVGIASCPQHGRTRDELIKSADAALYSAKQAGRNRVVSASIPAP
jgi:diguanylate cyclase (GGDEF)-like protein